MKTLVGCQEIPRSIVIVSLHFLLLLSRSNHSLFFLFFFIWISYSRKTKKKDLSLIMFLWISFFSFCLRPLTTLCLFLILSLNQQYIQITKKAHYGCSFFFFISVSIKETLCPNTISSSYCFRLSYLLYNFH